jgi:hypothetical protein
VSECCGRGGDDYAFNITFQKFEAFMAVAKFKPHQSRRFMYITTSGSARLSRFERMPIELQLLTLTITGRRADLREENLYSNAGAAHQKYQ